MRLTKFKYLEGMNKCVKIFGRKEQVRLTKSKYLEGINKCVKIFGRNEQVRQNIWKERTSVFNKSKYL